MAINPSFIQCFNDSDREKPKIEMVIFCSQRLKYESENIEFVHTIARIVKRSRMIPPDDSI
jgi:hypothetical protein